jgi:hypothetical protein
VNQRETAEIPQFQRLTFSMTSDDFAQQQKRSTAQLSNPKTVMHNKWVD